jgi:hypothetical protein
MWSCGIDFGRRSVTRAGVLSLVFLAVLTSAETPSGGYPVVLDGSVLFTIEAPRAPYTAAQRATDISNDLRALARSTEVDASSLRMVPGETDTILLAGQYICDVHHR